MTGKQIIDLEAAESFGEGDLMLVRKSGSNSRYEVQWLENKGLKKYFS